MIRVGKLAVLSIFLVFCNVGLVAGSVDLAYLIKTLQELEGEQQQVPMGMFAQERLFRALRNQSPPFSPSEKELKKGNKNLGENYPFCLLPEKFWKAQNDYLQMAVANEGIVDGTTRVLAVPKHPKIFLLWGDICCLKVDAIVNAANKSMLGCYRPGCHCIDNAIHSRAGLQLRMACYKILLNLGHFLPTGDAVITDGFNLPAKYVMHVVGPIIRRKNPTKKQCALLRRCYLSCLQLAEEKGLKSIAFCCISTGEFRFPKKQAAKIAINTVLEYLKDHPNGSLQRVIFCVYGKNDLETYQNLLGDGAK
ncbi:MAG: macro domain-containing protein [Oscillospiraceae bacterium]|jgi:O-acetyl-ADP-ribose deacetylase (regulator of RNase III)|nr:macro domain-containing protein [Oscillospiraceae bacterium]